MVYYTPPTPKTKQKIKLQSQNKERKISSRLMTADQASKKYRNRLQLRIFGAQLSTREIRGVAATKPIFMSLFIIQYVDTNYGTRAKL